jgi:hypothetical protein
METDRHRENVAKVQAAREQQNREYQAQFDEKNRAEWEIVRDFIKEERYQNRRRERQERERRNKKKQKKESLVTFIVRTLFD